MMFYHSPRNPTKTKSNIFYLICSQQVFLFPLLYSWGSNPKSKSYTQYYHPGTQQVLGQHGVFSCSSLDPSQTPFFVVWSKCLDIHGRNIYSTSVSITAPIERYPESWELRNTTKSRCTTNPTQEIYQEGKKARQVAASVQR